MTQANWESPKVYTECFGKAKSYVLSPQACLSLALERMGQEHIRSLSNHPKQGRGHLPPGCQGNAEAAPSMPLKCYSPHKIWERREGHIIPTSRLAFRAGQRGVEQSKQSSELWQKFGFLGSLLGQDDCRLPPSQGFGKMP